MMVMATETATEMMIVMILISILQSMNLARRRKVDTGSLFVL